VAALHRVTRSVAVVFVVVHDPVGAGFVESLARPGANITGFSTFEPEIGGKWLELLKEINPGLRRVAGIVDPVFSGFAKLWRAIEHQGLAFGLDVKSLALNEPGDDIESAIAQFAQGPAGGLIVLPTAINNVARDRIIASAARHRIASIIHSRTTPRVGG